MNLYHLQYNGDWDYDQYTDFIVAASDENAARATVTGCGTECRDRHKYEHHCVWRNPEMTRCSLIGEALPEVRAGIIVSSFRSG